ncbi:hypothetical protein BB560_001463 [Smittium megazygosporum]|uniref:HMG box domain-containing protein n=1 Tax=Smittium megazygosporum TaxID=133381 RepID=A0A2T9ZHG6_9FUNG|nr:hypothetical protein BB560_001463 [Smittium megazygosporum]
MLTSKFTGFIPNNFGLYRELSPLNLTRSKNLYFKTYLHSQLVYSTNKLYSTSKGTISKTQNQKANAETKSETVPLSPETINQLYLNYSSLNNDKKRVSIIGSEKNIKRLDSIVKNSRGLGDEIQVFLSTKKEELKSEIKSCTIEEEEKRKRIALTKSIKEKMEEIKINLINMEMKKKIMKEKKKKEANIEKKLNRKNRLIIPPSTRKLSVFSFFSKEFFNSIEKPQKPDEKKNTEIFKNAASRWVSLDPKEKARYQKLAANANLERIQKAKEWWANADLELIKLENKRRKKLNIERKALGKRPLAKIKNPFKIKNPSRTLTFSSSFTNFIKYVYSKKLVSGNVVKNSKTISEMWKKLSDEEKARYR